MKNTLIHYGTIVKTPALLQIAPDGSPADDVGRPDKIIYRPLAGTLNKVISPLPAVYILNPEVVTSYVPPLVAELDSLASFGPETTAVPVPCAVNATLLSAIIDISELAPKARRIKFVEGDVMFSMDNVFVDASYVNAASAPNAPELLYCTCVSDPAGDVDIDATVLISTLPLPSIESKLVLVLSVFGVVDNRKMPSDVTRS